MHYFPSRSAHLSESEQFALTLKPIDTKNFRRATLEEFNEATRYIDFWGGRGTNYDLRGDLTPAYGFDGCVVAFEIDRDDNLPTERWVRK